VRGGATQAAAKLPEGDALRKQLTAVADGADTIRKKIVATKEGGAITGEERLREWMDDLYGAITGYEGKPAKTLLDRTDALKRQLDDVTKEFETFQAKDVKAASDALKGKGLTLGPG